MPWLKAGDNAATHPRVMRLMPFGEEAVNEVFGFVVRCALQSAGHMTDYFVDEGTAALIGMSRTPHLTKLAQRAGMIRRETRAGVKGWRIVADPEFLHMRLRSEIEWERQRKADASNPALTVPVRLRDGDACRYCSNVVQWKARRGNRRGTYDHREPGRPATVDTYVVSCFGCNATRQDDPKADERLPLLPVPSTPFYGEETVELLARHGHHVQLSTSRPAPTDTATERDPAAGRTPRGSSRPAAADTANTDRPAPRPRTRRDTAPQHHPCIPAPDPPRSADSAETCSTDRVGSGRAGSAPAPRPGAADRSTGPPTEDRLTRKRARRGRRRGDA